MLRWINNCVGARNQKYFILYLIYVHFGVVLASILGCGFIYEKRFEIYENTIIVYLRELDPFNEFIPSWIANHIFLPFFDADILLDILTIIEVFFSSIFAVFVLFLLFDQIKAIRYDLTYVEYLKSYRVHTLEVRVDGSVESRIPFLIAWSVLWENLLHGGGSFPSKGSTCLAY